MLMASSVVENEILRKISGGNLQLFAQSTEAFLRAANVSAERPPAVEPVKAPAASAPAPAPDVEKKG